MWIEAPARCNFYILNDYFSVHFYSIFKDIVN